MSLAMLTEEDPITDQDQDQLFGLRDLPGSQSGSYYFWGASKPPRKGKHAISSKHRLYYKSFFLESLFRVEHSSARFHAAQALASQVTYDEGLTVWVSTHQLLEWVQLRAENTLLRLENERLHSQVRTLALPRPTRAIALPQPRQQIVPTAPLPEPVLDVRGFQLPEALGSLAEAIEESRSLLQLEDDWDGEGTRGYAESTWQRVVEFLVRHARALWERHGVVADHIEILPDTEGSLAIDWRTNKGELLITVPEDPTQEASYYADDGTGRRKSKGSLDTSIVERWLVCWLAG